MNENEIFSGDTPLVLTLCPEEESLLLNNNALEELGQPRQVQLLINEEKQMLLLKACSIEDREALLVPPLPREQFEVSGQSLLKKIRRMAGWTDMVPRQIEGTAIPEMDAIAFDIHYAVPVILKSASEPEKK